MKRVARLLTVLFAVTLAAAACSKKEPPPVPPPAPGQGMPGEPGAPHGMMGGGPEKKVVVPDAVKGSWKAVKVEVEYKQAKSKKAFTVALNSEFKIPDTDMTLKTGNFLPHFAMTADSITSNSNNLENPAVGIEIVQGGKEVFHGWLFSKFPDIHPFQNDKIALKLVEGIRK
ncbi:MAG: DUF2155 domain-containing protein [Deltaproteobacteria bacterium]